MKNISRDYKEIIRSITIPIDNVDDNLIGIFKWLSTEIYEGKAPLKSNSIHFIIVKILNRKGQTNDIRKHDCFDVFVIGDFRKSFNPTLRVAEAFGRFYLEMGVLPNIIPVPKHTLLNNRDIINRIKKGVVIYERR